MRYIDCRKTKNCDNTLCNECLTEEVEDLREDVESLGEDTDYLLEQLTRLSGISADGAETHYDVFKQIIEKIDLLADVVGVQFEAIPEVPAIPEHLALVSKKAIKKAAKKIAKKLSKKRK